MKKNTSNRFQIILVSSDENLSQQLFEKIRKQFPQLPLDISIQGEGKQALLYFEKERSQLIFVSENIPGVTTKQFVQSVRKIDGGTNIVILVGPRSQHDLGLEASISFIEYPILNWELFYSTIEQALPDEIKSRYGLKRRDSLLLRKIQRYGERYLVEYKKDISTTPLETIPLLFDAAPVKGGSEMEEADALPPLPSLAPPSKERGRYLELLLLLLLTSITAYFFWKNPHSEELVSLKTLSLLITMSSYLGLFASWFLKLKI